MPQLRKSRKREKCEGKSSLQANQVQVTPRVIRIPDNSRNRGEGFRRRSRWHTRKVSLDFLLKGFEIGFQNWKFFGIAQCAQTECQTLASFFQCNFSRGFGVADPLGTSARSHEITLVIHVQQVHGSSEQFAAFTSPHLKQINVGWADTEADEKSECAVEEFFERCGFAKCRERGRHAGNCNSLEVCAAGRAPWEFLSGTLREANGTRSLAAQRSKIIQPSS